MRQIAEILLVSSAPANLLAMAAFGALAGMFLFYRGFRLLQRKRLILNTPSSKIRSASMGLVEISGLAIGPHVLSSPLKQLDCFYYRSLAWQWKQRGRDSEWVKIAEESLHLPFYVDDGSGTLLVDPRSAEMDLHCDLHEEYNRSVLLDGPEMPASVGSFLARHGVDSTKRIKVEEYCIKPKSFLFVLGTLSQNPGLDTSVMPAWAGHNLPRAAALSASAATSAIASAEASDSAGALAEPVSPQVVNLSADSAALPTTEMTQQQKIAAALMKAGITNPAAWAVAGVNAQPAIGVRPYRAPPSVATVKSDTQDETQPTTQSFDLHPPVVLMKGSHDRTFFISWRSQRDLISALGWKSALMIWGGPALTLACVYILLAHFKWL
jgi:hypothetical protein